jgi:hypothetical protein
MFESLIESLRAWLESVRAWSLGQGWLSPLHEWLGATHVSAIWAIIVAFVFVLVLSVGFWPPAKDLTPVKRPDDPPVGDQP